MNKIKCVECGKEYTTAGIHTHKWRVHGAGKDHEPNQLRKNNDYDIACEYCNNNVNYRNISKHRDTCKLNPKNLIHCKQCNKPLTNRHQIQFCSRTCSAIYSNKYTPRIRRGPVGIPKYSIVEWLICPVTKRYYSNRTRNGHIRKLSPYLDDKQRRQYQGNKELYDYRQKCKFTFDVYDYPEIFDLDLVKKHGWYSPSNKGNNLNGVSRDHMLSIKYGFENNIDPNIIAHPANCQLLQHRQNSAKCSNSSITLEKLLERIDSF